MRKALILCMCICGLSSCLGTDWVSAQKQAIGSTMEPKTHPFVADAPVPVSALDTLVYFCGVRFPQDYDWRRDTALGNADAEVYLLENWHRKALFKSGYEHRVSPDPDTHHLIDGNLYTEFSTADRTFIKKNGEELFSYEGREKIDWMLADSETVYTLGRSRSGDGFSFRKNGGSLFERPAGHIIRGLHEDSGHIYFFYTRTSAGISTMYMVEDAIESQLHLPTMDGSVKDLIVWGGEVHILSSSGFGFSVKSSKWSYEGQIYGNYSFENPYFVATEKGPYVCGRADRYGTWTKALLIVAPNGQGTVLDGDGGYAYYDSGTFAACSDDGAGSVRFFDNGSQIDAVDGVRLFSENCVSFRDGIMAAGLSSTSYRVYPQSWVNGKLKIIEYHGYLSGAEVIPPSSASSYRQN